MNTAVGYVSSDAFDCFDVLLLMNTPENLVTNDYALFVLGDGGTLLGVLLRYLVVVVNS